MREPSAVFVQVDPSGELVSPARAGAEIRWNDGAVEVTAERISRVALRWPEKLPSDALILGDAWERSYGDLQWRHQQPERLLPWYFLAHSAAGTFGMGVDVQPNAFCAWTVDGDGFTLWLDLRNGGGAGAFGRSYADGSSRATIRRRGHTLADPERSGRLHEHPTTGAT